MYQAEVAIGKDAASTTSKGVAIAYPAQYLPMLPLTLKKKKKKLFKIKSCYFFFFLMLCANFSLVAASRGYSLLAAHELLIAVASLVAEQGLQGVWASVLVARSFSSYSTQA